MFSFYEMNCILEKWQAELSKKKAMNEALSDENRKKLAALAARAKAAKAGGTTAQVETPPMGNVADKLTQPPAAAPADALPPEVASKVDAFKGAASTPPIVKGSRNKLVTGSGSQAAPSAPEVGKDINDPENKDYAFGRAFGSKSRQMDTVATGDKNQARLAHAADRITQFNEFLRSPTYQLFTSAELDKVGIKTPDGPFILSNKKTGRPNEVVVEDLKTLMKVIRGAQKAMQLEQEDGGYGESKSFKQALAAPFATNPKLKPQILRAIQFERVMHDPEIVGKTFTVIGLSKALASKALRGGLEHSDPLSDAYAAHFLIQTAIKNGFSHFFDVQGDLKDLSHAQVTVKPLATSNDPLASKGVGSGGRYPNLRNKVMSKLGMDQPAAESNSWEDLQMVMENYGF